MHGELILSPGKFGLHTRLEEGQSAPREQKRPGPLPDSVLDTPEVLPKTPLQCQARISLTSLEDFLRRDD